MAKAMHEFGRHLLSGRIDLENYQISACGLTSLDMSTFPLYYAYLANFPNYWRSGGVLSEPVQGTIEKDMDDPDNPFYKVVVPDMLFTNPYYDENIKGLLFYIDTGDEYTSPLIGVDDIGPLLFTQNFNYVYKSSEDGLIRITL